MRRAAVLIAAAVLLAGCGSTAPDRGAQRPLITLCVDVGLPLSGAHGGAGRAVLAGLRSQIPTAGLRAGDADIRLCRIGDTAAGAQATFMHAAAAAQIRTTIAYVGAFSPTQAGVADAVLAQAGIPLLSPSGPATSHGPSPSTASGSGPLTSPTSLYLLPSQQTQTRAMGAIVSLHRCDRRRHGQPGCTIVAPEVAPLCSGITTADVDAPPRYCVLAGPDLSRWPSPATAYGASIGRLIVRGLEGIAAAGGDVSSRATVLAKLRHTDERQSPIGPIRFDAQGGIEADRFTAYTVEAGGQLVLSRTFRTH